VIELVFGILALVNEIFTSRKYSKFKKKIIDSFAELSGL
jgi:hypothetical protein